jgi:hypothetical protein
MKKVSALVPNILGALVVFGLGWAIDNPLPCVVGIVWGFIVLFRAVDALLDT